mgnify:CR=1 FL=1
MALDNELVNQGNFLFRFRSYIPFILFPLIISYNYFNEIDVLILDNLMLAICISAFGQLIRIFTIAFVPSNTSGRNTKKQTAKSLNSTGIYSLVRHPLYLGNYFILLGPFLLFPSILILIYTLLFWIYYERIMYAEENYLKNKFKEEFMNWAQKPSAFIPNFIGFIPPEGSFSFKRIIKREYSTICGIVYMFIIIISSTSYMSNIPLSEIDSMNEVFIINTIVYLSLRAYKKISIKKNNH